MSGRVQGLPQMLECFRQFEGRADGRWCGVLVFLSTYSVPHFDRTVVLTNKFD